MTRTINILNNQYIVRLIFIIIGIHNTQHFKPSSSQQIAICNRQDLKRSIFNSTDSYDA